MNYKKLISLLIAAVMLIALLPLGIFGNPAAAKTSREASIAELISFSERTHEMEKRSASAVAASKDIDDPYASARIIVKSSQPLDYTGAVDYVNGYNDRHIIQYENPKAAEMAAAAFNKLSYVEYAAPDAIVTAAQQPHENSFLSWGYGADHVDAFSYNEWLLASGIDANQLPEIVVGIIDSGIDAGHPFLAGRVHSVGYDFVDNDYDPSDLYGHGTHVAGTVVDGTLPNVKVAAIRVMGANGRGNTSDIINGFEYAYLNGFQVANASLRGGYSSSNNRLYSDVINAGTNAGTVYCVAAGNDYGNANNYLPAAVERAFTVAAHDSANNMAGFSNTGSCVDITAPGVGIYSSYPGNRYETSDGTSMATPHVAAACAMVKSRNPGLSADAVIAAVKGAAVNTGLSGGGAGLLSMTRLINHDYEQPNGAVKLDIANVIVASEEIAEGDRKGNAVDGNNNTIWHTRWQYTASLEERYITLELASPANIKRFEYQPRISGNNGRVNSYKLYVSMDGQSWTTVASGSWADSSLLKTVEFTYPIQAKFVKLEGVETYGSVSSQNNKFMSAAEIRVFGTASAIQQEYINFSVLNKWTSMDNNAEWGNGQDKYIPRTISYQLMANGQPYGQVQSFTNPFGGNKTWDDQASWSNVPKYDANGNEITYTLKVVSADERWLLTDNTLNNISGNNYRFELCHRWAMARINVSLAWQGGNGESIGAPAGALLKVNLMKRTGNGQGQQIATLYLDSSNSFSGTFKTTSYTNDGAEDAFLPRVFQKDANGNVVFQNDKPVLDSNAYYLVEEWLNPTYWEAVYPSSILSDSNYSGYSNGEFNVRIINRAAVRSLSAPTDVKSEPGS